MLHQNPDAHVMQMFSLKGKVALVTGGSRGIGLAAALGLAEGGADIAITYNTSSPQDIAAVARQFEEIGVKFMAYQCDVAQKAQIEECVDKVFAAMGALHVVVANAGIGMYSPGESFTEEDYRKVMGVNLDGAFFTAQAAANAFRKQKAEGSGFQQGRIIFTASVSSQVVNFPQKQAPYNASKAAVVRLAKCLAVEWVDFARVNCVSPGYIDTELLDEHPEEWRKRWFEMIPAGRMCSPYELKGVYLYLASDASSYMTGEEVVVGGGYSLI